MTQLFYKIFFYISLGLKCTITIPMNSQQLKSK